MIEISSDSFVIESTTLALPPTKQLFLNFAIAGQPYFLSAPLLGPNGKNQIRLGLPAVVYQAERRDRERIAAEKRSVRLSTPEGHITAAPVSDASADGLSVEVPTELHLNRGTWVQILPPENDACGPHEGFAEVRHIRPSDRAGWRRVGLSLTRERPVAPVLLEEAAFTQKSPSAAEASLEREPLLGRHVPLFRYQNRIGEQIVGIIDTWRDPRGATAVIIPPAWGRTKETLLPLAATILETFRSIDEPVAVVRFDGIRKRGESHLDPSCRKPGLENLRFTFSQGAKDIQATIEFLRRSERFRPSKIILVTFSVSSIEGRRAMAEASEEIGGWISVVGSADAQSLTRIISGGVDFFGGAERGVRFGQQEIQGMLVDMDNAAKDALRNHLAFLDDSRRDFLRIKAPITWIHGRHDAWMDLERIKHALQFGRTDNRRIVIVPTGHQLRTSEEAMATFELVASEVGRMALPRQIAARRPNSLNLAERAQAERARLRNTIVDLRRFWRDYLVGRSAGAGIALVASTSPYRSLMKKQIEALRLADNQRVADLGCGIGSFAECILEEPAGITPKRLDITAVDYVREALVCAQAHLSNKARMRGLVLRWVQATLDLGNGHEFVPLRSNSQDAVLLSLVLNYVPSPQALLAEIHRVLKPRGRLVMSSLRRDADISRICVDAVSELQRGRGREVLGEGGERQLGKALQSFISDASRLLDLEEAGIFRFWNENELSTMLEIAGFTIATRSTGLGAVPQAYVVAADKVP